MRAPVFASAGADRRIATVAAALGLCWFLGHGGHHAAWPGNTDWLVQNDWSQHYMGWLFFRHAPWSWPLGNTPGLAWPMGSSLAFTDSNPLLSVMLRPLTAWISRPVQFIGAFLAASCALQGYVAARLCRALGGGAAAQLAFAALLVACPMLLHRIDHDTLTAHWILLAAIYGAHAPILGLAGQRRFVWRTAGVAAFAATTHPYLLAMVWPVLATVAAARAWRRELTPRAGVQVALALGPCMAFLLHACGYLSGQIQSQDRSYHFFSANWVAWFNPMGWSRLLPDQPIFAGQVYEGFAYLGAGGLALVALGAALPLAGRQWPRLAKPAPLCAAQAKPRAKIQAEVRSIGMWPPLFAVCGAMALFAATDLGTWRTSKIYDVSHWLRWAEPLMYTFRSSGRFTWPLSYLALAAGCASTLRYLPRRAASAVLMAAACLQLGDVTCKDVRARLTSSGWVHLRDSRWALATADYDAVVTVPMNIPNSVVRCGNIRYGNKYELALGLFAGEHGMRINSAYTARADNGQVRALCEAQLAALQQGAPFDRRTLYVVAPTYLGYFARAGAQMRCGTLDGYRVCVAATRTTRFARAL